MNSERLSQRTVLMSFGVGCFHFGMSDCELASDSSIEQYVENVRNFLGQYPNIEEIEASSFHARRMSEELFELDEEGRIWSGYGIKPWPSTWLLEFTVHIPDRIQNEIWDEKKIGPRRSEASKYKISIHYDGHFPVAFVSGVDTHLSEPSNGVILIREYLEKYAPEESKVEFQFLGPSPFHADFFVLESTQKEFCTVKTGAYDDVFISSAVKKRV